MSETELSHSHRILIADDEASLRLVLATTLKRAGFSVTTVKNGVEALSLLRAAAKQDDEEPFSVLIADLNMPEMDGMTLLSKIAEEYEDLPVIILTAHGTVDLAVQALKKGAFDFVTKPYERDEVLMVVQKAIGQKNKNAYQMSHFSNASGPKALIGQSAQMQHVHDIIARVANTPSTVLITGESGTGKELIAHALHNGSSRRDRPFIRINCAAIPATLIEAELFGYEKGAFTGAVTSKPGRFELADGGTLFLDEIGDLPVEMQVKLLRVLQESTFERVGGIKTIYMDIRLIAATNQNLQQAIADGKFREDLYYRLNVVPIILPPLRERKEDIPALTHHFLHKYNARLNRNIEGFSEEAIEMLKGYAWPGNIRELENIVERTVLFADQPMIDASDLPLEIIAGAKLADANSSVPLSNFPITPLGQLTGESSMKDIVRSATLGIERDLILRALDETKGNVTHAARKLKISRKCMQLKMRELATYVDPKLSGKKPPTCASQSVL